MADDAAREAEALANMAGLVKSLRARYEEAAATTTTATATSNNVTAAANNSTVRRRATRSGSSDSLRDSVENLASAPVSSPSSQRRSLVRRSTTQEGLTALAASSSSSSLSLLSASPSLSSLAPMLSLADPFVDVAASVPSQPLPPRRERGSAPPPSDRTVRVFVSSPFLDMTEERDVLVKQTFPLLRQACAAFDVNVVECDLRWGISAEQAESGRALEVCLNEIDRCRPYFIAILGDRYGTTLPAFPDELMAAFPWLKGCEGRSVTDLEITHAILNGSSNDRVKDTLANALVYYRDSSADSVASSEQIADLKKRVSDVAPVRKYQTPMQLAQLVLHNLRELIERDFGGSSAQTSSADKETALHHAAISALTSTLAPRDFYASQIEQFIASLSPANVLVVTGESGSGKSTALAVAAKPKRSGWTTISHFVGVSSTSTDTGSLLLRIMHELQHALKLTRALPKADDVRAIIADFPPFLEYACSELKDDRRILLVLDGLDHIDGKNQSGWLPRTFPPQMRVLLSTHDVGDLLDRNWTVANIPSLDASEKDEFVKAYLAFHSKTLSSDLTQRILAAPLSSNARFLHTLLDELRVSGTFSDLAAQVERYASAEDVSVLYERILERIEKDLAPLVSAQFTDAKAAVGAALCAVAWSRRGLSEDELMGSLKLPYAMWAPIFLSLESAFARQRGGLLTLGNAAFRNAVSRRYGSLVSPAATAMALHTFFCPPSLLSVSSKPLKDRRRSAAAASAERPSKLWSSRALEEAPYELEKYLQLQPANLNRFQPLQELLSVETVSVLVDHSLDDATGYWTRLEKNGYDVVALYLPSLEAMRSTAPPTELHGLVRNVGSLLRKLGKFEEALRLYRWQLTLAETTFGASSAQVSEACSNLAWQLYKQREYDASEEFHLRALRILESQSPVHVENLTGTLNALGVLNSSAGKLDAALQYLNQALNTLKAAYGTTHEGVSWTLLSLANLHRRMKDFDKARTLMQESIDIFKSAVGANHLSMAQRYNAMARIYMDQDELVKAEVLLMRDLKLRKQLLGEKHADLGYPYDGLGELYARQKRYDESLQSYDNALALQRVGFGNVHAVVAGTIAEKARILAKAERREQALQLLDETLAAFRSAKATDAMKEPLIKAKEEINLLQTTV